MGTAKVPEAGDGGGSCDLPGDVAIGSAKRGRGERGGLRISRQRARKAAQAIGAAAAAPADRTQEPGTPGPGRSGRRNGRRKKAGAPTKRGKRAKQHRNKGTGKGKGHILTQFV